MYRELESCLQQIGYLITVIRADKTGKDFKFNISLLDKWYEKAILDLEILKTTTRSELKDSQDENERLEARIKELENENEESDDFIENYNPYVFMPDGTHHIRKVSDNT